MTTVGPLAPFLFGSWVGYSAGLIAQWKSGERRAKLYSERYPALMMYALQQEWNVEVPKSVGHSSLSTWIFAGNLGRKTMSILAAQGCRDVVADIEEKGRERVAEQYSATDDDDDDDDTNDK